MFKAFPIEARMFSRKKHLLVLRRVNLIIRLTKSSLMTCLLSRSVMRDARLATLMRMLNVLKPPTTQSSAPLLLQMA